MKFKRGLLIPAFLLSGGFSQTASDPITQIMQSLEQKHYDVAERLASEKLKTYPTDPRLWTLKAMALSALDPAQPGPAVDAFAHALQIAPDYLPALEGTAQLEYATGNSDAQVHLEHILRLQPSDPTANAMLAELEFQHGNYEDSSRHFEVAHLLIANQPLSLAHYAASLAGLGKPAEAIPLFRRVTELQPAEISAVYNLALAEFQNLQPELAMQNLLPLLASKSPGEPVMTLAADIDESLGKTQDSLNLLHSAMVRYPKEPEAYLNLANLSFAHSSVQVGIDILNEGLYQMPSNADLYLARGVLLAQLGKTDEAVQDFEAANRLNPKLTLSQAALGITQSQQHKSAEALATFRMAASQHKDSALTQYLLAEALAENSPAAGTSESQEELAAVVLATKLDPKVVAAHDLAATIYLRDGQLEQVVKHSEAALAVDPKDQEALFHLILVARKGAHKDQLPALIQRLNAARSTAENSVEKPHGYLIEPGR